MLVRLATLLMLVLPMSGCQSNNRPLVIAHRGASGEFPEHSMLAYNAAAEMQADMLEPDVVASKDGVLICSHDLTLEEKTDIATRFPGRARNGQWHALDFTSDELSTLTRRKDGKLWEGAGIVTLDQMLAMVADRNAEQGSFVVIPELKAPTTHAAHGIDTPVLLLEALRRHGFGPQEAIIQCFEPETLKRLRFELDCPYPLLYLVGDACSEAELDEASAFADGIGPSRKLLERDSRFVSRCHLRGLLVYPYTYNDEPGAVQQAATRRVNAVFSNYPDRTRAALDEMER